MKIKIAIGECERIKELSMYNHNYYVLPIEVDGHKALYEECHEDYDDYDYYLGDIVDGKFVQDNDCYYPYVEGDLNEPLDYFVLDSKYKNVWFS